MIDLTKKYTANGNRAEFVLQLMTNSSYLNVFKISYSNGTESIEYYNNSGNNCYGHSLVEYTPYSGWEIDDKVLAKFTHDTKWEKRHFAGLTSDGEAKVWVDGKTSYTGVGTAIPLFIKKA